MLDGRKAKLLVGKSSHLAGIAHAINGELEEGSRRRAVGFDQVQIIKYLFLIQLCGQLVVVQGKVCQMAGVVSQGAFTFAGKVPERICP